MITIPTLYDVRKDYGRFSALRSSLRTRMLSACTSLLSGILRPGTMLDTSAYDQDDAIGKFEYKDDSCLYALCRFGLTCDGHLMADGYSRDDDSWHTFFEESLNFDEVHAILDRLVTVADVINSGDYRLAEADRDGIVAVKEN